MCCHSWYHPVREFHKLCWRVIYLVYAKLSSLTKLEKRLPFSSAFRLLLVKEELTIAIVILVVLLLSTTLKREITIWSVIIHPYSSSRIQLSSQILFTPRNVIQ
jgi:hypothetical protein